jgi:hypothetical protein
MTECMGETRNLYNNMDSKPQGKRLNSKSKHKWEHNIVMI